MTSWLHRFLTTEELARTLDDMGCDGRCLPYFDDRRQTLCLRVPDVDTRAANALKQEMLSRGGDVAVHKHAIDREVDRCDCLLFGTAKQIRHLEEKLAVMPYWGLDKVREELAQALANLGRKRHTLKLPRGRTLELTDATKLMAILNLTPDSFYCGSRIGSTEDCLQRAAVMVKEGADILDLGAESTRPGAEPVDAQDETSRLVPAIRAIRESFPDIPISVDTTKADVAEDCIEAGADIINDISGLGFDPGMPRVLAETGAPLVLMHIKGIPRTMQKAPDYESLPGDICRFFEERLELAERTGISRSQVILDPGLGFGKTAAHNLELLKHLEFFRTLGLPLLIGHSRKSTLGKILELSDPAERLEGTLAVTALCAWQGVEIVRVHDVRANRRVLDTIEAVKHPERFA